MATSNHIIIITKKLQRFQFITKLTSLKSEVGGLAASSEGNNHASLSGSEQHTVILQTMDVLWNNMKYSLKQIPHFFKSIISGRNVNKSFTENFLKMQCLLKQQFTEQWWSFIQWDGRGKKRHVLTEDKLNNIGPQLEASPRMSKCLLALRCGISRSTLHAATKLLKLWPYRMTVLYSLLPSDYEARHWYWKHFQQSVSNGLLYPELVLFCWNMVYIKWLHNQTKQQTLVHRKSSCCPCGACTRCGSQSGVQDVEVRVGCKISA